jgi:hypothetical protein
VRETEPAPVPEGTRLVHIGPHKTGTTTLQGAFHLARREAERQGVHYVGPNRQPLNAAQEIAAIGNAATSRRIGPWRRLVAEVERAKQPRVIISSEWFADARSEGVRRLSKDLDPARVHVVVTLRPLGRILASQWQQLAQAGHSLPYDRWLESVFHNPTGAGGALFWQRHAHDRLIERWAEVVGSDRVTVVVADDRDRGFLLRAFEGLSGLRSGTLVAPDDRGNRSLTMAEIEVVRQLYSEIRPFDLLSAERLNLVLFGVAGQLKLRWPDAAEARTETPEWALAESAEIARRATTAILASGARIIGDIESLVTDHGAPSRHSSPLTDAAWAELGAAASMGMLTGSGLGRRSTRPSNGAAATAADGWPDALANEPRSLGGDWATSSPDGLSIDRLIGVLVRRVRGGLRARIRRPTPRPEAPSVHSPGPEVEYRSRG